MRASAQLPGTTLPPRPRDRRKDSAHATPTLLHAVLSPPAPPPAPHAGDVLMVRFYEGEGAATVGMGGPRDAPREQRLETLLSSLVDVPVIMQTMPAAIKRACMVSR